MTSTGKIREALRAIEIYSDATASDHAREALARIRTELDAIDSATPAESMLSFCPSCNATDAAVRRDTCRDAWHGYNPRRCSEPTWLPRVGDLVEMYDMPSRTAVRVAEALPGWRFLLTDGSAVLRDCHVSNLKPAGDS